MYVYVDVHVDARVLHIRRLFVCVLECIFVCIYVCAYVCMVYQFGYIGMYTVYIWVHTGIFMCMLIQDSWVCVYVGVVGVHIYSYLWVCTCLRVCTYVFGYMCIHGFVHV
jgi:hypothetical protein